MDNSQILIAVAVVAAVALLGRLVINKHQPRQINWQKIIKVFVVAATYVVVFLTFDPYAARIWWLGEASLADGKAQSIAGRSAGSDIPTLSSTNDIADEIYYAPKDYVLKHSDFYRLKNLREAETDIERRVDQSENEHEIISRKTSTFRVTRHPSEVERYLPVYVMTFADSTKMLCAVERADSCCVPVSVIRHIDEDMQRVLRAEQDSTIDTEFYLLSFNEQLYSSHNTQMIVDRATAAAIAGIFVGLILLIFWRKKR